MAADETISVTVNPLMGTLRPQSNGPLYSNTVIDTLAVDGWAVQGSQMRSVRILFFEG